MGWLDVLLGRPQRPSFLVEAHTFDPADVVRLTDGVYNLLYHQSYAERCERDGLAACSVWLHEHMDALGAARSQHERLIILAKYRNGDRSFRDLPKS